MDKKRIPVTVMVFTLNESVNLPSCLAALADFDDVIVVDSYSTDATEEIARGCGARFFAHAFEGFGSQRNWALQNTGVRHPWVLILDADERVTPGLRDEIARVTDRAPDELAAFRIKRRFYMWGKWLRHSSLYPTWVIRLIRLGRVRYVDRGHAETQQVDGRIARLSNDLIDENRKGIGDWYERQDRYASKEASHELLCASKAAALSDLFSGDPLVRREAAKRLAARVPARGLVYFVYIYFMRLGFLDGSKGLRFCLMKAQYQQLIAKKKREQSKGVR